MDRMIWQRIDELGFIDRGVVELMSRCILAVQVINRRPCPAPGGDTQRDKQETLGGGKRQGQKGAVETWS